MSKPGTRGRWNSGASQRYSPNRKIDDTRWVRKNGNWRLETKQRAEPDYCFSRRAAAGFRNGARIRNAKNS